MILSVIISNRNDTAMLSVTVRSCIEELRGIGLESCEIIIVDNSDPRIYKLLNSVLPTKYIRDRLIKVYRQEKPCLFKARETAVEKASGKYIVCIDSHMIIGHRMFEDLLFFMEKNSRDKTIGFAHAPINWAHQHESSAKHDRDMSKNELGDWNTRYDYERTITWKGMPWICRKDWFLSRSHGIGSYGALSDHGLSWGGGDMHIGIKPWLLGYKNFAVPCNPGIHIGPFPKIDQGKDSNTTKVGKYRLYANSGNGPHTIGFLVSCYVLGGEQMMLRNKSAIQERFGKFIDVEAQWEQAKEYGKEEKVWLDSVKKYSFEELLQQKPWE